VPPNRHHYGCNVSTGIMGLTHWRNIITYQTPCCDQQGVCENGCGLSGQDIFPICTDP